VRAFVTGGTGFVGANLVAELNERGIAARVLHRPSSSLAALDGLHFESVHGDILDEPAQLAQAMDRLHLGLPRRSHLRLLAPGP
jgi:dihydroflavonol-4-reductase